MWHKWRCWEVTGSRLPLCSRGSCWVHPRFCLCLSAHQRASPCRVGFPAQPSALTWRCWIICWIIIKDYFNSHSASPCRKNSGCDSVFLLCITRYTSEQKLSSWVCFTVSCRWLFCGWSWCWNLHIYIWKCCFNVKLDIVCVCVSHSVVSDSLQPH